MISQSDPKRQRGQSVKPGEVQASDKAKLALQALRRAKPEQLAHDEPQVARHRRHQVPLLHFFEAVKPRSATAAAATNMSKSPFDPLAALTL